MTELATRGTTNGNARGSSYARRARRAWLMVHFAADVSGFCRCYRCGALLYNPDDWSGVPERPGRYMIAGQVWEDGRPVVLTAIPLTVDRIIPGCQGGRYTRNNIRPACGPCNSETGGSTRRRPSVKL